MKSVAFFSESAEAELVEPRSSSTTRFSHCFCVRSPRRRAPSGPRWRPPACGDRVGEAFAVVLKLSLATGLALATPVWIYHLWAFVAPALRGRERRYALPFTVLGVALSLPGSPSAS